MPIDASTMGETPYLRMLLMGQSKVGKTTNIIKTCLASIGSGYVIECSSVEHLRVAQLENAGKQWQYDVVKSIDHMEVAIKAARAGVKEGKYRWVLVDDFNIYANLVEDLMEKQHAGVAKVYFREYLRILRNVVYRLFDLPETHLVFTMHYNDDDGDGGIAPLLTGKAKKEIPGLFPQIVWMSAGKDGARTFNINPPKLGVGCNNIRGARVIAADVGLMIEALREGR